jgi:hypothetical protein
MFEPFSLDSIYYYHRQKIEDFINKLAATPNPNELATQHRVAHEVGINLEHLTSYDISYIEKEVAKRWGRN